MDNGGGMSAISTEKVVEMWNNLGMGCPLSVSDLSPAVKPTLLMGALMEILFKLGIDRDYIVAPPREEERDEHTEYYWDLLPAINMTRVVNHILSGFQDAFTITMMDLLNPSPRFAHSILLLLINLATFYGQRRDHIEPRERELFQHREQVAALEEQKNRLLELLNEQAAGKASRAMRLQKLEEDKKALAEELKNEKLKHEHEVRELEQVLGENRGLVAECDKRRAQLEAMAAEVARVRAQRVLDADDIRAQREQAARGEREATDKLEALKEVLIAKQGTVRNLLGVRARLEDGIQHVLEITRLTGALKEMDATSGRQQEEVDVVVCEREGALREAETQLAELQRERRELHEETQREAAAAKLALSAAQSGAREAEARWRAGSERAERAAVRVRELRAGADQHANEKVQHERRLDGIREHFFTELKSWEELILQESKKSVRSMEEKLSLLGKR